MIWKFKKIIIKFYDVIPYLFFGFCTTGLNVISFWLFNSILNFQVLLSTCIAWIFAVSFAYVTNRKWVFHSQAVGDKEILRELFSFFFCRLGTGVFDFVFMYFFVVLLNLNGVVFKLLSDVVVVIFNYIASKFFIFKSK